MVARFRLYKDVAGVIFMLGVVLLGCGHAGCPGNGNGLGSTCGQTGNNGDNNGTNGNGLGQLYVDSSAATISIFPSATTLNGSVVANATIQGSATQLSSPGRMFSDPTNDTLYVTNAGNNSVLVFTGISTQTGDAPPSRVLGGTGTQLSSPTALTLDFNHDVLYVANPQAVLAFDNASTITGVVAPARTISGTSTGFKQISSLCYDSADDVLYVVDAGNNSVLAFSNASTVTGNAFPNRNLSGSATTLSQPEDAVLENTRMFICNGSGSILRFENILTSTGNIAPSATVSGSDTQLSSPQQLAIDVNADQLYVNNTGNTTVLVFSAASTLTGSPFPGSVISLSGVTSPTGMAIDFTR